MKVCVYILSSVKGVAYTILLQAQIKKVVLSGKFEVWKSYLSFFFIVSLLIPVCVCVFLSWKITPRECYGFSLIFLIYIYSQDIIWLLGMAARLHSWLHSWLTPQLPKKPNYRRQFVTLFAGRRPHRLFAQFTDRQTLENCCERMFQMSQ